MTLIEERVSRYVVKLLSTAYPPSQYGYCTLAGHLFEVEVLKAKHSMTPGQTLKVTTTKRKKPVDSRLFPFISSPPSETLGGHLPELHGRRLANVGMECGRSG